MLNVIEFVIGTSSAIIRIVTQTAGAQSVKLKRLKCVKRDARTEHERLRMERERLRFDVSRKLPNQSVNEAVRVARTGEQPTIRGGELNRHPEDQFDFSCV